MNERYEKFLLEKARGDALSVLNIRGGSAIELLDLEIAKVLANIKDPNTDGKTKRSCTLTLSFGPNEEGTISEIDISVKSALAGPQKQKVTARLTLDKDGNAVAEELNRQRKMDERVSYRSGITVMDSMKIGSPIMLKPFSIFLDVDQPEVATVCRVGKGGPEGKVPYVKLTVADGGLWKLTAQASIKAWLKEYCPGVPVI